MVKVITGNIFDYDGYIINPINDQGIMGKGLSLQFKKNFPKHFEFIRAAGYNNKIEVGKMIFDEEHKIIGFPTKMSWKGKSHMKFIIDGLQSLKSDMVEKKISKVYSPALGCGLGGLQFEDVLEEAKKAFDNTDLEFIVVINEKN